MQLVIFFLGALALMVPSAFATESGVKGMVPSEVVTVPDKAAVIRELQLEAHVEGGYYKRTFQSDHWPKLSTPDGERMIMSSIYYLLTDDSPTGHWHVNKSDIVHYYHLGAPLQYFLLHPDGSLEIAVMGPDLSAGQQLQLTVPGGVWKASHLAAGEYGLVSEAVTPAFVYEDMTLGERAALLAAFPQHRELIMRFSRD